MYVEPIIINVNDVTLEKMRKFYDSQMVPVNDNELLFRAKAIGCEIIAKTDGTIELVGQNALREAKHWSKDIAKELAQYVKNDTMIDHHIGSAETGSGDYLGPICFVSCYVTQENIAYIESLGIENIDALTNQDIVNYAKVLKDQLIYSLLILDNSHYNKMAQNGFNQANIKAQLFNQATVNVMQKVQQNVKVKVINQFVSPKTYFNYLKDEVIVVKDLMFEQNAAKKYPAVLAAEILSRYAYLQYFANMTKSLKTKLCRGTGSNADIIAANLASKYGEKILTKVAKLNYTNTKKVKALLEAKK